jgi:hypothetical protein
MYGNRVIELAIVTAATSNRPYGRVNDTLCEQPTIGIIAFLLHPVKEWLGKRATQKYLLLTF